MGRFRHGLEIGEGGVPRTVGALGLLLEGGRRLAALGPQVLEIQLVEHGAVVRHRLAPAQLRVLAEGVVGRLGVGFLQAGLDLIEFLDVPLVEGEVCLELLLGEEAAALGDQAAEILGFMSH